jgi:hypothetical protein
MPTRNFYAKVSKKLKGKETVLGILLATLFLGGFIFIKELAGIAGDLWFIAVGLLVVSLMATSMINTDRDSVDKTANELLAVLVINMTIVFATIFWFSE